MKLSFRQFMEQNIPGTHNDGPGSSFNFGTGGAFITSDQSGSETQSNLTPVLPAYELITQVAPHTDIFGKIAQIKDHQAPYKTQVQIRINLSSDPVSYKPNGKSETILINTNQYRVAQKANGGREPKEGDKIAATLLKLPSDNVNTVNVLGIRY